MKLYSLILVLSTLFCLGQECCFYEYVNTKEPLRKIKDSKLIVVYELKPSTPPEAISIHAFKQEFNNGKKFKIQVNLSKRPPNDWMPVLKFSNKIISTGIVVSRFSETQNSFSIETNNHDEVVRWVNELRLLLRLPQKCIVLSL